MGRSRTALEPQARVDVGPLGVGGGAIEDVLELQDVVFRKRLPARVGDEPHLAPVGVTDDYLGDRDSPLPGHVGLTDSLYALHVFAPPSQFFWPLRMLWAIESR